MPDWYLRLLLQRHNLSSAYRNSVGDFAGIQYFGSVLCHKVSTSTTSSFGLSCEAKSCNWVDTPTTIQRSFSQGTRNNPILFTLQSAHFYFLQSSPHAQKPFAFSPKVSTRSVNSSPAFNKSMYARSPDDTPSRVLSYGPIPSSSSTISQASSISDYLQTPSPIISAYRGRHSGDVGRAYSLLLTFLDIVTALLLLDALDGSYLSRILPEVDDDED